MSAWDLTICPSGWTGHAVPIAGGTAFVCGACLNPQQCADADSCTRAVAYGELVELYEEGREANPNG